VHNTLLRIKITVRLEASRELRGVDAIEIWNCSLHEFIE